MNCNPNSDPERLELPGVGGVSPLSGKRQLGPRLVPRGSLPEGGATRLWLRRRRWRWEPRPGPTIRAGGSPAELHGQYAPEWRLRFRAASFLHSAPGNHLCDSGPQDCVDGEGSSRSPSGGYLG